MSAPFAQRYGPWAVVAGASEGLGAAFARALAAAGVNVLLVARRAEALEAVAAEVRAAGAEAKVVVADLAAADAAAAVLAAASELDVGLVVLNAAFSPIGPFLDVPLAQAQQAVAVNVLTPLALCHGFGRRLRERRRGGLVLLSSLTAFQGSPYLATYGATKAFGLTFAEGLWAELRGAGVDVLAVCAGATKTPNFVKAQPAGAPGLLEPAQVAREALAALGAGPLLIPGWFNRLASFAMRRLMPRRAVVQVMGSQTRRLST